MDRDPLYILAALAALIAASEWLARHTPLRHLGSALLVIVLTALAANTGVVPTWGDDIPVYGAVFEYVAPLGIFWLLLQVDLHRVLKAGVPMLFLFLVGSAGTVLGVFAGMWAVGGRDAFGALHNALGGMFAATYTGGSVNFNAVALEYGVMKDGVLFAGAAAVDSAMTTVWMAATVALPRLLARVWPRPRTPRIDRRGAGTAEVTAAARAAVHEDQVETLSLVDLAWMLALGAAAVYASKVASAWLAESFRISVPPTIVLTSLALVLAQVGFVKRLRGAYLLGLLAVYFFLAVIGALCDVSALREIGELAARLGVLVAIIVLVHGIVTFGAAAAFRLDPAAAAVASQANVGGSASALALARSLDRQDLVLPAILVGSIGTAIGNYLGFLTAGWLA